MRSGCPATSERPLRGEGASRRRCRTLSMRGAQSAGGMRACPAVIGMAPGVEEQRRLAPAAAALARTTLGPGSCRARRLRVRFPPPPRRSQTALTWAATHDPARRRCEVLRGQRAGPKREPLVGTGLRLVLRSERLRRLCSSVFRLPSDPRYSRIIGPRHARFKVLASNACDPRHMARSCQIRVQNGPPTSCGVHDFFSS